MRRIELRTELAASADQAWARFIDTEAWPSWGGMVRRATGELRPGTRWHIELRPEAGSRGQLRSMHPTLLEVDQRRLLFETIVGAKPLVRMTHAFIVEAQGPQASILRQSFEATGLLAAPMWRWLEPGMRQFEELGRDLARALG